MYKLDQILEAFHNVNAADRYEFIAEVKALLNKKPELRVYESHPIFKEMILHHIDMLKQEQDGIRNFLITREDTVLDYGVNHAPYTVYEGFIYLNKKLGDRLNELQAEIDYYEKEYKRRLAL